MLYSFFLFLVTSLAIPQLADAGFIQLSPSEQTVFQNEIFPVGIAVDTEGVGIIGVDTLLRFDPTRLQATEFSPAFPSQLLFPEFRHKISNGLVEIMSFVQDAKGISGAGPVGTVYFRALKSGRVEIDVDCTPGSTIDSNMGGLEGDDVHDYIDCEKSHSHFVTIEPSSGQPTSPQPHACPAKIKSGDYNCDDKVSLADFESWRADYIAGRSTIKEFEYFREGFTDNIGDQAFK